MSEYLKMERMPKVSELDPQQQNDLCAEIRDEMIRVVSRNGGHLASNLGVVELTVALHDVFDFQKDTLIFDVGHQCYVHKLLTGRQASFATLRKEGGLSGFPKPEESDTDPFIEGHASTSISQAVGLSFAKQMRGDDSMTLAVIGDGALTGGLAYEAMNSVSYRQRNLMVILNDNSMSISKSVGSVSNYLLKLRYSEGYLAVKEGTKKLLAKLPLIGRPITRFIVNVKEGMRRRMYGGTLFEELGFNYVGPIDGHNLRELEVIFDKLNRAKQGPYLVHVITQKGKGYKPAEENPDFFHGVGAFDAEKSNPDLSAGECFSNTFGRKLSELASADGRICAVTAAMKDGTGLQYFSRSHPQRFFDVGIAEQHAVTMCSGLSKGGKLPVFCVYSTFLQRCVDGLIHDISLGDMDFLLAVDRAGFVGDDGETHQGLYDVSFLNSIGTFRVFSPSNYDELNGMTERAVSMKGPRCIRYPRGAEDPEIKEYRYTGENADLLHGASGARTLFITYGREFAEVRRAARMLEEEGIGTDILKLNRIAPLDAEDVRCCLDYDRILFAEEALRAGGVGQRVLDLLNSLGYRGGYRIRAIESSIVRQAPVARQLQLAGLDAGSLYQTIKEEAK